MGHVQEQAPPTEALPPVDFAAHANNVSLDPTVRANYAAADSLMKEAAGAHALQLASHDKRGRVTDPDKARHAHSKQEWAAIYAGQPIYDEELGQLDTPQKTGKASIGITHPDTGGTVMVKYDDDAVMGLVHENANRENAVWQPTQPRRNMAARGLAHVMGRIRRGRQSG